MIGFILKNKKRIVFTCLYLLIFNYLLNAQLFESLFSPENYVVYRCPVAPKIDGIINDSIWDPAPWTEAFVDIEGRAKPKPKYDTHVKMLWDNKYLYIAARLYDKQIWATLKKRESVIFQDNDFEVFIDPNGDAHNYMEIEINAFGTIWDSYMEKPYRDGGYDDNDWNFEGMKSAVKVYGKINRTTGKDSCWIVELALPWEVMIEFSDTKKIPVDGEQWRMNFSRIQWKTFIKDFEYHKERGKDEKPLPEMNWVWSPQNSKVMHQPETWGHVQFSTKLATEDYVTFIENPDDKLIWSLWQVYYLYQDYPNNFKRIEEDFNGLRNKTSASREDFKSVELGTKRDDYLAKAPCSTKPGFWYISKDGRLWFVSGKTN